MMLLEMNSNWNSPISLRTYKLMKMKMTLQTEFHKLEQALIEVASNSLPKKEKNANKPWVSSESLDLTEQWQAVCKKYKNHSNPENHNTWRNIDELADISLVNDKINKTEQMCIEANVASNRNDTKELFNIVKKLNRESSKTLPFQYTSEMVNHHPHSLSC